MKTPRQIVREWIIRQSRAPGKLQWLAEQVWAELGNRGAVTANDVRAVAREELEAVARFVEQRQAQDGGPR